MTLIGERQTMRTVRDEWREDSRREIVDTALRIVIADGLAALTTRRLATELGCGIGLIQRRFTSKDALIAEVQTACLARLGSALAGSLANVDDALAARGIHDPDRRALTRLVGAATFWATADTVYPAEVGLTRRLFTDPTVELDQAEAEDIVPAGVQLAELAACLLDEAADTGALHEGDGWQRGIIMITGIGAVAMTAVLGRWDRELFDATTLAAGMTRALLVGWGAEVADLAAIDPLIASLQASGELVPAVVL